MGRPRREILATFAETSNPPSSLSPSQLLCRVLKATGNNLFSVEVPGGRTLLVELPAQFRSTFWIKRGGYVLVDTEAFAERDNKLDGEIANVILDERMWRKMGYWPKAFGKRKTYGNDEQEEEDESNVGKMPPSSDDEEG